MARSASSFNRSSIFKMAWRFVKANGFNLSEALRTAWRHAKLKAKMATGICRFWFQKVDGTIREAYGTLKENLLPPTKGTGRKSSDAVQVYFDTEKSEFRSFKVANLLAFQ